MRHGPRAIGTIVHELMVRRGFGRVLSAERLEAAWRAATGEPIAHQTRVGIIRRGKLEITVAHSTLVQELMFRKTAILAALREALPEEAIHDLRFRVGPIL